MLLAAFNMSDHDIQIFEIQFSAFSGLAFAEARSRVLASGQSVLKSKEGVIFEVFSDGRRIKVKQIEPPTPVVAGSVLAIR